MARLDPVVADSLERVGTTVILAGLSAVVVELQDWPQWWALILLAMLNTAKTMIAARFGDPDTGGFYTPPDDDGDG